ncbi:hypothetical protein JOD67_006972 [Tenggerimyces flavus]|nr:hypothetical protein [Tenggerimyces flavus]
MFAIFAARCLLMSFLRRPSYCLSSFTLEPWSLAVIRLLHRLAHVGSIRRLSQRLPRGVCL